MRLSIGPVRGQVNSNPVDLAFQPFDATLDTVKSILKAIDLLAKRLLTFDHQIELVLKRLVQNAKMSTEHVLELFHILFRHSPPIMTLRISGKT